MRSRGYGSCHGFYTPTRNNKHVNSKLQIIKNRSGIFALPFNFVKHFTFLGTGTMAKIITSKYFIFSNVILKYYMPVYDKGFKPQSNQQIAKKKMIP
jgi:hypothetical protein